GEPWGRAVGGRLLAPAGEQRPDDPARTPRLDAARSTARDEPVEDGLDLVGRRVPGGSQPLAGDLVADAAKLILGAPALLACVHYVGAEGVTTEARVRVRLGAAEPVVDMERRDLVSDRSQGVPQARGVGAAGDEARDGPAGRDQVVPPDVAFDPLAKLGYIHAAIVAAAIIAP